MTYPSDQRTMNFNPVSGWPARWFEPLRSLYRRMDVAYDQAAKQFRFCCNGCQDSCCRTLFFHHTLCECLYLRQGLSVLSEASRARVIRRARTMVQHDTVPAVPPAPVRDMCPLNEQGRCILYAHRPMICRLHGIPHRLQRPDGKVIGGPGCAEFEKTAIHAQGGRMDRTPFYGRLAMLEKQWRARLAFSGRINMTIAEILLTDHWPGDTGNVNVDEVVKSG